MLTLKVKLIKQIISVSDSFKPKQLQTKHRSRNGFFFINKSFES